MQLNYKKFGSGFPVIILHGLLGSLDNWQSIAKKLAEKYEVYTVDLRNHGKSPHSDEFNYEVLSADLLEFMQQQQLTKAHLIGHSLGGKVVMKFALEHPEKVERLIVVDMSPGVYPDQHTPVFNALLEASAGRATTRDEVLQVLRQKLNNDEITVQFLMKALVRDETGEHFKWRFNVSSLRQNYDSIMSPLISAKPFTGKALFIKGEFSDYINAANYADINALFPDNQLTEIKGAGHWVHADKPAEFVKDVENFLG